MLVADRCSPGARALGLLVESVGGNAEASRLVGIRARGIKIMVYVFCALCAGIAGLMISSNVAVADGNNAGLWIELDAILAVVIGGTSLTGGRFHLGGTVVGALDHPDADHDHLHDRRPAADQPGVQGRSWSSSCACCSPRPSAPRCSAAARRARRGAVAQAEPRKTEATAA